MRKRHVGFRIIAGVISTLFVFAANMICTGMAQASTTKVEHKAPKEKYIPGFRINLDTKITDKAGLLVERCYFKTKNDKNFAFVNMVNKGGSDYQATLPAPFVNSEAVNYLFVVVNKRKEVTRTQMYTIEEGETKEAATWKDINEVKEIRVDEAQEMAEKYLSLYNRAKDNYAKDLPRYQTSTNNTALQINTELSRDLVPLNGFYDAAVVTEVASSAKYGFLAENLYPADAVAANGGAGATGAVTAGTVTATAGGLSTGAIVGGIVGAAAIGGGIAAASGSSDDGGGGGGGGSAITETDILGFWNYTGTRPDGITRTGTMSFNAPNGGTVNYVIVDADGQSDGSGTATWNLSGSTLTLTLLSPAWSGTATGDATTFHFSSNHGTYTFTR